MLSGEFSTIALDQIQVNRSDRIRKNISGDALLDMADSIRKLGLIHPIVLDRDHVLVAGETRLMACKTLGWIEIPFQYSDTLEARELLAIEIAENVKRKDLDWKDKADAIAKYHAFQKQDNPKWTVSDTGRAVGYSIQSISDMLGVAEAIEAGDEKITSATRFSAAVGIVARTKERRAADAISAIHKVEAPKEKPSEVLVADFNAWAPAYSGPPFNLLHLDLPYGIGFDSSGYTSGEITGRYEDSEETYWTLTKTLLENIEALAGESCHMVFWFSMKFYQPTLEALRAAFKVNPVPLIWFKSDNKGIIPNPNFDPRHVYETAFLASRGDRKIIQPVADVFSGPTEKIADHASEKSESMLRHFFRMFVDSNTRLLDPTAGSGGALRAAKAGGAASVLGLEINEIFANEARRALDGQS